MHVLLRRVVAVMMGSDSAMLHKTLHRMHARVLRYRGLYKAARSIIAWQQRRMLHDAFAQLQTLAQRRRWETSVFSVVANRRFLSAQRVAVRSWKQHEQQCLAGRAHANMLWVLYGMRTLALTLSEWSRHIRTKVLHRVIGAKIAARHRMVLKLDKFDALHYAVHELKLRRNLL